MAVDDTLMRDRVGRGPSSIRALLDAQPATPVPEEEAEAVSLAVEELSPLPRPGDAYKAFGRIANKPVLTLHFLLANGSIRGFPFLNLDALDYLPADQAGHGMVIVLRFSGLTPTEIRISGRNLDRLYDMLGQHRTPWVRELPPKRDFLEAGTTVITGLSIKTLEG